MSTLPLSPRVADWFGRHFPQPTPVQLAAWPVVSAGRHCLVSAGTGQGKTLAALLPLIDRLLRQDLEADIGRVLYVAPLRALSNNMADGLADQLASLAGSDHSLRVAVRSGDTPRAERQRQRRLPPHVLLTTPESLFVLLGSAGGRDLLSGVGAVVIDEVHALMGSKRGAHLSLSLERLELLQGPLPEVQRIGLSATARPATRVARFLTGPGRYCELIVPGKPEAIDLRIELGPARLGAVAGRAQREFILDRICAMADGAGKTLVFCNTRGMVEQLTAQLVERLGSERVAAHHGSLGQHWRAEVEDNLRSGELDVVVCSSSLELGIDIGQLERVCQIGQVRELNALRQRGGRSGHRPGQRPRMHLFPLTLTDLLDAHALSDGLELGVVEPAEVPEGSQDVLAQQLVAMVAAGMEVEDELFRVVRRSAPWASLARTRFERVLDMLHHGYVEGRETGRGPLLRLGAGRVRAAGNAARLCLMNPGTLPEWFDYDVVDLDRGRVVGRLDEEFGFESSPGQVIQLGGANYRIERIRPERIEVRRCESGDAVLPFWLGDGCGRSAVLSALVSRRLEGAERGRMPQESSLAEWLLGARSQLGALPSRRRIILERFFDPGGDEHLVIHSVFGQRINRAWGLALRKRFCRRFNFELQAAATDNAILISLGATHSFGLEEVIGYLSADGIRDVVIQALLDTPQFSARMRWCANTALAIPRQETRGRVAPQIQRNQVENLIARVFPDQLACLENLSGPRQLPDHPLVEQALADCLDAHMDLRGLERVYRRIESGRIETLCLDTPEPSLLAQAVIHAPRHGFLDPAAAEERRTRAFEQPGRAVQRASPKGIQATPPELPPGQDGLESCLLAWGYLPAREGERLGLERYYLALVRTGVMVSLWTGPGVCLWVHVDRLSEWLSACPAARIQPFMPCGLRPQPLPCADEARRRLVVGAIRRCGQVEAADLAVETGLCRQQLAEALAGLEAEGLLRADGDAPLRRYCERRPNQPASMSIAT